MCLYSPAVWSSSCLVLTFLPWPFRSLEVSCVAECPSMWISVVFSHDSIQALCRWQVTWKCGSQRVYDVFHPISSDGSFDHLIQAGNARSLHCKVTVHPFIINNQCYPVASHFISGYNVVIIIYLDVHIVHLWPVGVPSMWLLYLWTHSFNSWIILLLSVTQFVSESCIFPALHLELAISLRNHNPFGGLGGRCTCCFWMSLFPGPLKGQSSGMLISISICHLFKLNTALHAGISNFSPTPQD